MPAAVQTSTSILQENGYILLIVGYKALVGILVGFGIDLIIRRRAPRIDEDEIDEFAREMAYTYTRPMETYKNLPNKGKLKVTEPEGEHMVFTVVRQPKRGQVVINEDGSFEYTPKKNKVGVDSFTYTATDPEADENGQEFAIKKRAKSLEEAKRLATAKLRILNRRRVTGSMTLIGDVTLVAGVVVKCVGFGSFDGNFIIEEASHSVDSGGYTTSITLRRVNNNY